MTIYVGVIKDYTDSPNHPFKHWISSGYMHKCFPPGQIVLLSGVWYDSTYACSYMEETTGVIFFVGKDSVDIIGEL